MDYTEMAEYHWSNNADITVAVQPVHKDQASRFGTLQRSSGGHITDFIEKPKDPQVLNRFRSREDAERPYIGSMGIYLFKSQILVDLLASNTEDDFGGEVILGPSIHTTYLALISTVIGRILGRSAHFMTPI